MWSTARFIQETNIYTLGIRHRRNNALLLKIDTALDRYHASYRLPISGQIQAVKNVIVCIQNFLESKAERIQEGKAARIQPVVTLLSQALGARDILEKLRPPPPAVPLRVTHASDVNTDDQLDGWLMHFCNKFGADVIHLYSQEKDSRTATDTVTQDGWCLGCVALWLRCLKTEEFFWGILASRQGEDDVRKRMWRHIIMGKSGEGLKDFTKYLQEHKLSKRSESAVITIDGNAGPVAEQIFQGAGCYALIVIGGDHGSHALGAYIGLGQKTWFFDPNSGEFFFKNKTSFISWFKMYFWGFGYLQSYTKCQVVKFN